MLGQSLNIKSRLSLAAQAHDCKHIITLNLLRLRHMRHSFEATVGFRSTSRCSQLSSRTVCHLQAQDIRVSYLIRSWLYVPPSSCHSTNCLRRSRNPPRCGATRIPNIAMTLSTATSPRTFPSSFSPLPPTSRGYRSKSVSWGRSVTPSGCEKGSMTYWRRRGKASRRLAMALRSSWRGKIST